MPPLALRDRAYAFLVERGSASDDELLRHVFGGVFADSGSHSGSGSVSLPAAVRERLLEPLLGDPRLRRTADGWSLTADQTSANSLHNLSVAALAIAATGPRPARHRLLGLTALQVDVEHARVVARFAARFNPGARVPGYVAQRTRLDPEVIDDLPTFAALVDDLLAFLHLGSRPVVAQEARTTWAFVEHEARRAGRTPPTPTLIDLGALADLVLDLPGKPSLPSLARHLGIGMVHVGQPDDEARVLAEVASRLLLRAAASGLRLHTLYGPELASGSLAPARRPLRQAETARDLPDAPGVYRLRDAHDQVLYVGKARRLRQRLQDYLHRPLGATRRLEGLADAVSAIDTTLCGSDLQALILEDREIRRLGPRYNTQRRLHAPRLWLRRDPRGLRLCDGPDGVNLHLTSSAVLGPFRNMAAAQAARQLARAIFGADHDAAWAFLHGDEHVRSAALDSVRSRMRDSTAGAGESYAARRALERLLAHAIAYDVREHLLPADPRQARYAVVRPAPDGDAVEVFVVEAGILVGQARVPPADLPDLLHTPTPATDAADRDVVLRWLGSQRPPARLVHLADDGGLDALFQAVAELLAAAREA